MGARGSRRKYDHVLAARLARERVSSRKVKVRAHLRDVSFDSESFTLGERSQKLVSVDRAPAQHGIGDHQDRRASGRKAARHFGEAGRKLSAKIFDRTIVRQTRIAASCADLGSFEATRR